jgi:hypothetical protein
MDFIVLLPTLALAAILWLSRNLIKTRLVNSVQHEFNLKLESIRSDFRQREEALKADIRAKEVDIAALRSGAMTAMASRQIALDNRRLEAIDQLWSAITALAPGKGISALVTPLRLEVVAKQAAQNPQFRELLNAMSGGFDLKKVHFFSGSQKARPFVSPMAWALYSAYAAIILQAVLWLHIAKSGVAPKDYVSSEEINKLVKTALPHHTEYIEKYGDAAYYFLLDELENRILEEFRRMLAGEEADKASIEKAAEILKLSTQVSENIKRESIQAHNIERS